MPPSNAISFVTVEIDHLRFAAALAHSCVDGELELVGAGRRWIVSFHRRCATVDPCGFRQLVLATARGCRVGLLPIDHLRFVGGLTDIGGGVYESCGDRGPQRRIATVLPPGQVEAILRDAPQEGALEAHVSGDLELGVTVLTLSASHPAVGLRIATVAQALAASCMVEELIAPINARS